MPPLTFSAAYVSEAARTLAELVRLGELDRTGKTAPAVIGDLRVTVLSMRQVVDQLAFAHTDPGLPAEIRGQALATADELHQAGTVLDDLAAQLDTAARAAEHITTTDAGPARKWVSVANLHGGHATEALNLLDTEGPEGAAVFLSQWDSDIDTDDQAIDQRRTRTQLPLTAGDQAVSVDAYTIVANPSAVQIAMYRLIDDLPSMALIEAQDHLTPPAAAPVEQKSQALTRRAAREQTEARQPQRSTPGKSWFDPPATKGTNQGRGRSL